MQSQQLKPVKPASVEECVELIIKELGSTLVVGAPLGIGKPNHLLNALWRKAKQQPSLSLEIFTALSLEIPTGKSLLEKRFLQSFTQRHFGDYPELEYIDDIKRGDVPANMRVSEFYMQSGKYLASPLAQRWYTSSNYTHVARDMADRGVNVLTIMVGCESRNGEQRYSLGSNPDVTLDLVRRIQQLNDASRRLYIVALVNREMPFMTGQAEVGEEFFNAIIDQPEYEHPLFAVPREPISSTDYMIGLHASTLIADGGSLQIGIGALGDAFVYASQLRHSDAALYQDILHKTGIAERFANIINSVVGPVASLGAFKQGLYAATEMFTEGFIHLYQSGILKRRVYPDLIIQNLLNEEKITAEVSLSTLDALMQARAITTRLDQTELDWLITAGVFRAGVTLQGGGSQDSTLVNASGNTVENNLAKPENQNAIADDLLGESLAGGALMHAAFFLGSKDFYSWLHALDEQQRELFQMTGVGQVNELYDGEPRDRAQRLKARFINSTMKVSLTGAACSDGLDNHQVVSGVGGQYNFVAMAHALADSRSVLMLRAVRNSANGPISNVVWQYPYETIPRHLRDLVISEYGIADLRGKSDEDCIKAMLCIADSRFQQELLKQAQQHNKLDTTWQIPAAFQSNLPATLDAKLSVYKTDGLFADFPYGCDFNVDELRLLKALKWLKPKTKNGFSLLKLLPKAITLASTDQDQSLLTQMDLSEPNSFEERLSQKLLLLALKSTR